MNLQYEAACSTPGAVCVGDRAGQRVGPLAPGDVLVRISAAGLCHTDLEVIDGSLAYPLPIVLGHEGAGVIVDGGRRA